jgi:Ala-tRNA(Pro) deacylase
MAVNERVMRLLEQQKAEYEILPHREAFTSQEIAESVHVAGRMLAKVVVVREPSGGHLMVVVPATCHVDLAVLCRETGRPGTVLAGEDELRRLFPDCELGAMPPFGRLYGMPMYLDRCLERASTIYFQAGNHHEVVGMDVQDFIELARPLAGEFCLHEGQKQA